MWQTVINASLERTANLTFFALRFFRESLRRPFEGRELIRQMDEVGAKSLLLVAVSGLSIGVVLSMQSRGTLARFGAEAVLPSMLSLSVIKEIGPIITALVLAGRLGAGIAAEIGSMRVTEQIDALVTLSTNPFKYMVAPRLIAGITMLPLLVLVADVIGVMGGYLVGVNKLGFNGAAYLSATWQTFELLDVISGLVKAAAFGLIIALMGCYHGYHSQRGAQGVGAAATNAVVSASILILVTNYFVTELFFAK